MTIRSCCCDFNFFSLALQGLIGGIRFGWSLDIFQMTKRTWNFSACVSHVEREKQNQFSWRSSVWFCNFPYGICQSQINLDYNIYDIYDLIWNCQLLCVDHLSKGPVASAPNNTVVRNVVERLARLSNFSTSVKIFDISVDPFFL